MGEGWHAALLSPPEGANAGQPSILYFRVDDIEAAYDELRARGVDFLQPPRMIHKHDSGVAEWTAFFADPDGHPLAIMAQVPAA